MIRIVFAVDVVPGHEAEWEEQWRRLREARSLFPGFRGASLLRDSQAPTRYLSLTEWDGHDDLVLPQMRYFVVSDTERMRTTKPLFVRPLTDAERAALAESVRSSDAVVVRRAQIVRASAAGERSGQIAPQVGFTPQAVRDVIRAFNARGLEALRRRSSRPGVIYSAFDTPRALALREMLHQSPRIFDQPTSVWTLELAAEVAYAQGLTARRVSGETIRATLARMGVQWRRAKEWITSPDPEYARKKARRDRLIRLAQQHPDWLLGFEDEVWWSRLARPSLHTWQDDAQPLRLIEQTVARDDPDPKALACYGLLARWWVQPTARREEMWLRFVDGRPLSAVTIDFLRWCAHQAQARGKRAVLLIWDNASWHDSQIVRSWLRQHNRQVKRTGQGVRLIASYLPSKSPWLNSIEPKWLVGKKRVAEPDRVLSAAELEERVCSVYDCPREPHLIAPSKVPVPILADSSTLAPTKKAA
jgi:transposase